MPLFRLFCAALLLAGTMIPVAHAAGSVPARFDMKSDEPVRASRTISSSTEAVALAWWIRPQFEAAVLANSADVPDKTRVADAAC